MPNKKDDREELSGILESSPAEQHYRVQPDPDKSPDDHSRDFGYRQLTGLFVGPLVFMIILLMPAPAGMEVAAQRTAAVAALMAIWWISEAIPIPATSLLPIALFPFLGVMGTKEATAPYANHLVFLFMGGFIIALAMQRWNLHRRIALTIISVVGFSPGRMVFGFMLATAALSAFVSNTATAVMMMPIGLAVISQAADAMKERGVEGEKQVGVLGLNLMLGIAYAASIGGVATLIGTPPNAVMAGYLSKNYNFEITFVSWMKVGFPLVAVFLPLCWLWLIKVANPMKNFELPGGRAIIQDELKKMGPMSKGEFRTLVVFVLTGFAWIFRKKLAVIFPDPKMVTDAAIAICGAVALFLIPVNFKKRIFVMEWAWAAKLPWGVLILFGGGLALADGFKQSQLGDWVVNQISVLDKMPVIIIVLAIALMVTFLTELTSNTATAAILMPVLAAVAISLNQHPMLLLVPAAISASCAFMLPVATPPNAIVFGSGQVTIPQMVRSGIGLNLIGVCLVTLTTYLLLIPIFGIVLGELPAWAKP